MVKKIYNSFWLLAILFTRIVTGFVSTPKKTPLLYETYSVFRLPTLYNSIFMLQIFPFLITFLISLIVGILHFGTGFGELEHAVLSGAARDLNSLEQYTKWNVPIYRFHSAGCLASLILLCFYYRKEEPAK